jgi:hypothetical protein
MTHPALLRPNHATDASWPAWVGASAATHLKSWIEQHAGAAPITSNQEGAQIPFQRWFRFKEAFSPRFVLEAISSLGFRPDSCLDPFGGSGTTALTCQFLGIRPSVVEVNPFLADLIESKLCAYNLDTLLAARVQLARRIDACGDNSALRPLQPAAQSFPGAPDTFVEPGRDGRWIFDGPVAQRIAHYRAAISGLDDAAARRLFRVLLGSLLVPVSNVVISGKGRRYRRPSKQHIARAVDVDLRFEDAFQRAYFDICRYHDRPRHDYQLMRGDARTQLERCEPVDVVLCSPPYPNSFDYTDIYNVELWALGYLSTSAENRALREATLRSHVQIKGHFDAPDVVSPLLADALGELARVRSELWDEAIPAMVRAYFADMATVLNGARRALRSERGRILLVVGDSRYAGVHVPVASIIRDMAPSLGLRCTDMRAVRAMRSSAQQGGVPGLSESLLVLAPS